MYSNDHVIRYIVDGFPIHFGTDQERENLCEELVRWINGIDGDFWGYPSPNDLYNVLFAQGSGTPNLLVSVGRNVVTFHILEEMEELFFTERLIIGELVRGVIMVLTAWVATHPQCTYINDVSTTKSHWDKIKKIKNYYN